VSRPTAEDRRLDYLGIGAEIVKGFGPSAPMAALANVKVADVADRAGVTKGAVYHIWPSQEAYRRDLLGHMIRLDAAEGYDLATDLLRHRFADQSSAEDRLRVLCDSAFDRIKDNSVFTSRFSFYLFAETPEINALLRRTDDDVEQFWTFFDSYLTAVGRRLRPEFTRRTVFVIVSAYFDGLVIRHQTSPDAVEKTVDRDGVPWRLYAYGTLLLLERFSEPVDDDTPRG
jgi:AcrR family transcriptional regulator